MGWNGLMVFSKCLPLEQVGHFGSKNDAYSYPGSAQRIFFLFTQWKGLRSKWKLY